MCFLRCLEDAEDFAMVWRQITWRGEFIPFLCWRGIHKSSPLWYLWWASADYFCRSGYEEVLVGLGPQPIELSFVSFHGTIAQVASNMAGREFGRNKGREISQMNEGLSYWPTCFGRSFSIAGPSGALHCVYKAKTHKWCDKSRDFFALPILSLKSKISASVPPKLTTN